MYERDQLFIDGKWHATESESVISVVSPHSEEVIGHAACAGPADVDRAVQAARAAFDTGPWPRMQPGMRIEAITRLAGIYKEHRADMAALISAEIGAPISFAKMAQVRLPLTMMSAFCGLAAHYEWQQDRPGVYGKNIRIRKQPVGVVAAVVPWNMPQFLRSYPRCWRGARWSSNRHRSRYSMRSYSPTSSPRPICRPVCSMWCPAAVRLARCW